MAVRESATTNGANRRGWFVAACLVVLFVAALFLRAYWNLDAAHPSEDEYILSGGSDPYYHKRAADQIQANGFQHHLEDPLLNYPIGFENPNPPLYEWMIAAGGQFMAPFFGGDVAKATWEAAIWSPAILGALTMIPIYFLGAILFDRRAGLVAALLWTVSTSAIDSTGLGLADHDAAVLFFTTLGILFYVQSIRYFRGDQNWVKNWRDGGQIASGIGRLFRERAGGFAYALLAAVAIAAVALTWKGFNYVLGIIFIYAVSQMVVDHWRSKDSTGIFLGSLVAMGLAVIISFPFYSGTGVANFLQPTWYILGAFIVAGLVLVPTRDLPTILVMPAALVAGVVSALVAFFVFPSVAQSLLYATVYFKQTNLYQTISEAQPADFSTIAFGIGPVAFFLALAGWAVLLFRVAARPVQAWIATSIFLVLALLAYILTSRVMDGVLGLPIVGLILGLWLVVMFSMGDTPLGRTHTFALVWAAVALFMAQSAVRFLTNAIPVFAILAGFMAIWVLDWLDFAAIRKSLAANRGNFWQGLRKGTRPLHVIAAVLIAILFVAPTTLFAADAAMPSRVEDRIRTETDSEFVARFFDERMGAYGGSFQTVEPWIRAFDWLEGYADANYPEKAPADRPAFLAWWDYGHWAAAIGNHPTVADNFQNGYEFAADFILARDEAHAIQLLAARTAAAPNGDLDAALTAAGSTDVAGDATRLRAGERAGLTVAQSVELLRKVEEQTGRMIRYFATDIRMLPFDNPQTANIDAGSIFPAPVRLANEEPDDYVTTMINTGTDFVTTPRFRELASNPVNPVRASAYRLDYQEKFFETMFWRAYVGTEPEIQPGQPILGPNVESALVNPRPGAGLEHFRTVYVGEVTRIYKGGNPASPSAYVFYPEVILSEYYHGATVTGTLTQDGQPLEGVTVTVFDDSGDLVAKAYNDYDLVDFSVDPANFHARHGSTQTGADGSYTITAPFSMPGGNVTLVATRGEGAEAAEIARATVQISRAQAQAGDVISGVDLTVSRGTVTGFAYNDVNRDGRYDETNDTKAVDVDLTVGGRPVTTDADGNYTVEVLAGRQPIFTSEPTLRVTSNTAAVVVPANGQATHNVGLEPRPATYSATVVADRADGTDPVNAVNATIEWTPNATVEGNTASAFTVNAGPLAAFNATTVQPGSYVLKATWTDADTNEVFELELPVVLAAGEQKLDQELVLVRKQDAP